MLARSLSIAAIAMLAVPAVHAQCTGNTCKVTISVQGATCSDATIRVQPDEIQMGRGGNKTIVWRFDGGDFRFCASDGVVFKTAELDSQFFGAVATDDEDGEDQASTPGPCRRHFRWRNKNEPKTFGKSYSYVIRFTGPGGQACVKDPFIRNG